MPRYEFRADPAWVTVSEGLSLAFRHWRATATWWAMPVLAVGILSTLVYWGLEAALQTRVVTWMDPSDPYGSIDLGAMFIAMIPQLVATTVTIGIVAMIARWVYYALAITGLRGGELTSGLVVGRGLRALAADLLLLLVSLVVILALAAIASTAGIGAAILVAILAYVGLIFVQVRLAFWTLIIFDGAGITEAARASWRASEGAVLRMIGWALAAVGVGFVVNIGASIATFPLSDALPLQSGVKMGVTEAFAVFQLFTLAVLYESQLRRTMPDRAAPVAPPPATQPGAWAGYAPSAGIPPWPSTPAWPPATAPAPRFDPGLDPGPRQAWDEPPVNPDAPDTWGPKPADPDAPPAPPQPPAPPA